MYVRVRDRVERRFYLFQDETASLLAKQVRSYKILLASKDTPCIRFCLTMKIVPITLFLLPFVQGTNAAVVDEQQRQKQQHLRGLGEGGGDDDPCGFKGTWIGEGICSINFPSREEVAHGCARNRKLKLYPNDDGTLEATSQVRACVVL